MKIRIELDTTVKENEFIIRCNELTEEVTKIQKIVSDLIAEKEQMIFYKGNTEYYIGLNNILF